MLTCQKDEFYLPKDIHYLNCAYMAPLPRNVEDAGIEGIRRKRNPTHVHAPDFFDDSERVRKLFGELIHAEPASVALIPSVSYGMATAAKNIEISRGQRIVLVHEQFPSNVYTWRRLAGRHGAKIVTVKPDDGAESRSASWNERILDAIGASTAVVALANVHWADGTRFDLEAIGERAREVGAAFVVDGTQSVGALPLDVRTVKPDALICAGYKWLFGPYAIGMAYFSDRLQRGVPLEENWIARRNSEAFSGLVDYEEEYQPGAIRFDVGERSNFILVPMMAAALDYVLEWTPDAVQEYCKNLTDDLVNDARDMGYQIEQENGRGYHLFGIRLPSSVEPERLRKELALRQVSVSVRGGSIRISPHVYNQPKDVDALREALAAAAENTG